MSMSRIISVSLVLSVVLLISLALNAGSLNPPAPPTAGTMKTLQEVEPRIVVNSTNTPGTTTHMFRINQPGSYYLDGNLNVVVDKGGILIEASNVTVDLRGHQIYSVYAQSASPTYDGIYATDRKNIRICNGNVEGFYRGIVLEGTSTACAEVENVGAIHNTSHGFYIAGTSSGTFDGGGSTIVGCSARSNGGHGISAGTGFLIENCRAVDNAGIGIMESASSVIRGCNALYNDNFGIVATTGTVVQNCAASYNGNTGIDISVGCSAIGCIATGNTGDGIAAMIGSMVQSCTAYQNTSRGIKGSVGANIRGNVAYYNDIGIYTADGSTITGNTAYSNTTYGIQVAGNSLVAENTSYVNGTNLSAPGCTLVSNHAP